MRAMRVGLNLVVVGCLGGLAGLAWAGPAGPTKPAPLEKREGYSRLGNEPRFSSRDLAGFWMARGQGGGMALADYDDDGDVDIFAPSRALTANRLYRNRGDGTFDEVAGLVGLDDWAPGRSALWFDADGDGLLDLVVAQDEHQGDSVLYEATLRLWRQLGDGTFVEATAGSGLEVVPLLRPGTQAGGLAAGDLTGDGRLDLVFTTWDEGAWIFENTGAPGVVSFADISASAGIAGVQLTYWQPMITDLNGDGLPDVFVAHDFGPNLALVNQGGWGAGVGSGSFVDQAAALGLNTAMNEMGVALGDSDNDGDADLYVTNLTRVVPAGLQHCVFFENTGLGGAFAERALEAPIWRGGFGWGTTFVDYDLDGWLDLAEVNSLEGPAGLRDVPWKLWRNLGTGPGGELRFVGRQHDAGIASLEAGSALAAADLDRDGDADLVATILSGFTSRGALRVMTSDASAVHADRGWVVVRPRMPGTANGRAIGAVVRVTESGRTQSRWITAGTSFLSQEPAEGLFGFGDRLSADGLIDRVVVEWPDGTSSQWVGVPAGAVVTLNRP